MMNPVLVSLLWLSVIMSVGPLAIVTFLVVFNFLFHKGPKP